MKEAIEVSDVDYEKFKKTINAKTTFEPSKEWVEKQKDEKFQSLFKELWPNVYSRISESEAKPKPANANELLAELEKKRIECENRVKFDLSHIYHGHQTCCNSTHSCNCLKVCQVAPPAPPKPAEPPKKEEKKPDLNILVSSYDFPWPMYKFTDTLVKSSYNPKELEAEKRLLKNIEESQEKLKEAQKLNKTTDLIDDMIGKFKLLQDEMKKKSEGIRLKAELIDLKKEIHRASERSKSTTPRRHKSRSSSISSLSSSDRSLSREKHICKSATYSILKPEIHVSCSHLKARQSYDSGLKAKAVHVKPKVKCWNCNCGCEKKVKKIDMNIY